MGFECYWILCVIVLRFCWGLLDLSNTLNKNLYLVLVKKLSTVASSILKTVSVPKLFFCIT